MSTPEELQREQLRLLNLLQELDVATQLLETGFAILQRSRLYHTKHFAFLLLLTSGFERLMKITLTLRTFAMEQRYLSQKDFRRFHHNLVSLRDEVIETCFTSDYRTRLFAEQDCCFITCDPTLAKLFAIMSDFAKRDCYAYLDGTAEPVVWPEGPPDRRWGDLEFTQIPLAEFGTLLAANQDDVAKQQSVRALVIALETCVRAFARLFIYGVLGDHGRSKVPASLRDFATLPDEQLGTRSYSVGDDLV